MDLDALCEPFSSSAPCSLQCDPCSSGTSTSTSMPVVGRTIAARRSFSRSLSVSPVVPPMQPPFPHQHPMLLQLQRQGSQQPSPLETGPDLFASDSTATTAPSAAADVDPASGPLNSRGGWFSKCRGCGQLTSGEYMVVEETVPFCTVCCQQMQSIPGSDRLANEQQLLSIHKGWCRAGH